MVFVKDERSGDRYTAMAFSYNKQLRLVKVVFDDGSIKEYRDCHCKAEVSMGIVIVTVTDTDTDEEQEG